MYVPCNHPYGQSSNMPITPIPLLLFVINTSPSPDLGCHNSLDLPFLEFLTNGIMQCTCFCVWVYFPQHHVLGFHPYCSCLSSYPFSINNKYLVFPQFLALTNKVAVNISRQLSVWAFVRTLVVSIYVTL